jgi:hypothetical protein
MSSPLRAHVEDIDLLPRYLRPLRLAPCPLSVFVETNLQPVEIFRTHSIGEVSESLRSGIEDQEQDERRLSHEHGTPNLPQLSESSRLSKSADLGRRLAALLDPETDVPGVTTGTPPPTSSPSPSSIGAAKATPTSGTATTASSPTGATEAKAA